MRARRKPASVIDDPTEYLDRFLVEAKCAPLHGDQAKQFADYLSLILRWNARTNLTAVRDARAIVKRHFVESIVCAAALPAQIRTLLDYGSGAGFPGIPIAVCRPEISVTLAESQNKKAAFLQEATRVTGVRAQVHAGRAETLADQFDCITLRAVDQMETAVRSAVRLLGPTGWIAPLTTCAELPEIQVAAGPQFIWDEPILLPDSKGRVLAIGHRITLGL